MHGAGIVRQQQMALAQLVDKLIERSLPDPIYAGVAERSRDLLADYRVVFCSEQNPLHGRLRGNCCGGLSEPLRQPIRRVIPLSQDSSATRNEFGKRIAASKLDCRRSERTAARSELPVGGK